MRIPLVPVSWRDNGIHVLHADVAWIIVFFIVIVDRSQLLQSLFE